MKLGKVIQFYYMNESYQVSCLSHNVNINIFGIFASSVSKTSLDFENWLCIFRGTESMHGFPTDNTLIIVMCYVVLVGVRIV